MAIRRWSTGRRLGWAALLTAAPLVAGAQAEGLLNAACTPGNKWIVRDYKDHPTSTVGRGHNMAAFVRGKNAAGADTDYMMLVWSQDSGKGDGGISFWNWDSPAVWSAPKLRKHFPAAPLREAHSTPVTNMFANDWRTWVLQATNGFSVYNLDSIVSPVLNTNYTITGSAKGGAGSAATCSRTYFGSFDAAPRDYSQGAVWFLALAAPYLYVAQADNGLNIYRFASASDPRSVSWFRRLDRSWFGHRVNQVCVMGNLMIVAALQNEFGVTILDVSDPANPVRKSRYDLTTSPVTRDAYAWTPNGSNLYAAAKYKAGLNPAGLEVYKLNLANFTLAWVGEVAGNCGTGGYAAVQDRFAHVGLSTCYHKIDIPALKKVTPSNPPYSIGITGADNDFATPMGNAVFIGNDHHTTPGSAVMCHVGARDTTAPAVNAQMPPDGSAGARVTTGIGLSFTDNLRPWTIDTTTLPIRRRGSATAIPGHYSYQLNIVNFRPAANLDRGTTYDVVVTSGIRDIVGNAATGRTGSFQTEAAITGAVFHDAANPAWTVRAALQEGAAFLEGAGWSRSRTFSGAVPGSTRPKARACFRWTGCWSSSSCSKPPTSICAGTAPDLPGSTAGMTAEAA